MSQDREIRSLMDDPEIVSLAGQLAATRKRSDSMASELGMTGDEARERFSPEANGHE